MESTQSGRKIFLCRGCETSLKQVGIRSSYLCRPRFLSYHSEDKESISSYIQRLERAFVVAYGRDELTDETKNTMLHSQLQEGLRYDIMRSPAVSGSQSYKELVAAARNEENSQAQLRQRHQQVVKSAGPHQPPRTQTANVQPSKSDI